MFSFTLCLLGLFSTVLGFKLPEAVDVDLHKPLKLAEIDKVTLTANEFSKVKNIIQEHRQLWSERIFGGSVVPKGDYNFEVIILHSGMYMCTGTLMTDYFVLSSASCFDNLDINFPVKVIAGAHNITDNSTMQVVCADYLQMHGKYRESSAAYDIAVISMLYPFRVNNKDVSLVKLPDFNMTSANYTDKPANVTGWGITAMNGNASAVLRSAPVTVFNCSECAKIYTNFTYYDRMMLCAGNKNEAIGPCRGDGPLIADNVQIGILSARMDCDKSPAIYTLVAHFVGWINWAVAILSVTSNFE